jgi:hypothetical protein
MAGSSSKMSVTNHKRTLRHILADSNLHQQCSENAIHAKFMYKFFVTLERQRILLFEALTFLKCADKWQINNIFCQLKIQSPVTWR